MTFLQSKNTVLCMMIGSLFLAGCWPFGSEQQQKKATLQVINVLENPEYQDCHIAGSINIPFDEFESTMVTFDKKNHYVIYCADYMCMSSAYCAKLLLDAKIEHVWAYEGGMAEWYQKGYPCQGPAQQEYLSGQSDDDHFDDESRGVPTISAEQLLVKMQEFGMQA